MSRVLGGDGFGALVAGQDIYEISATAKHRLGTRLQRGDCVYRYAKAGMAITDTSRGLHPYSKREVRTAAIPATGGRPVGSNSVLVTVNAADGEASDGVIDVHALTGGYIILVIAGWLEYMTFGILDNTAAASGSTMTVTLDGELPVAIVAATSYCDGIMGNPYRNVLIGNNVELCPFVGIAMRLLTVAAPYGWLKTWGPNKMTVHAPGGVPQASSPNADIVFRHDGTGDVRKFGTAANQWAQHAGHVMTSGGIASQGAPFVFLQIAS